MATKYLVRQVRFPVLGRPLSGKETAAQGTVRKREEKKREGGEQEDTERAKQGMKEGDEGGWGRKAIGVARF